MCVVVWMVNELLHSVGGGVGWNVGRWSDNRRR